MNRIITTYAPPRPNELIAQYILDPDAEKYIKNIPDEAIIDRLTNAMATRLAKECVYHMYKKSVHTGRIYDGFYNYVPAMDPVCETVFEARFTKYSDALIKIEKLEKELEDARKVIYAFNFNHPEGGV